jgi:thiol-disulfide isomerase/thioredoxin
MACGVADTDGDMLSDSFEELIGTNPELGDSDGDGFTDAEEYLAYFDPDDRDDFPYEGGYPRGPLPREIDGEGWGPGDVSNSWDGEDQHGQLLDLHKFYGNVVMIDIGSEWCGPCNAAAPIAEEHYQDFKDEGFMVFGLLMDGLTQADGTPDIDRWIEGHELTYPVLPDPNQEKVQHYVPLDANGSYGIPLFGFIGRDMTIEIHGVNGGGWTEADIEELLEAEVPYVEWPMPENTGDLRAEFGITVANHHDSHLDTNIALSLDAIGSGASVQASGNENNANEGDGNEGDSNEGDGTGGSEQTSTYAPSNADGTYSRPPWGGADCSLAQRSGPGTLALLFCALGFLGLVRRRN